MPKGYLKYIARSPKALQSRLLAVVDDIENLRFDHLDIKKLQGSLDLFRVRVGKFRIIFRKEKDFGEVVEINTRGDIY